MYISKLNKTKNEKKIHNEKLSENNIKLFYCAIT